MSDTHNNPAVLFGSWLSETKKLQEESFGFDFARLAEDKLVHADYLRTNSIAAVAEIIEALEETRWKPWAADDGPVIANRRAFAKEMVDSLHFISNALVSAGVTDEEFNELYLEKMQVNRDRQAKKGGYQSRRGIDKCGSADDETVGCGRSFDDVGASQLLPGLCLICEKEKGISA